MNLVNVYGQIQGETIYWYKIDPDKPASVNGVYWDYMNKVIGNSEDAAKIEDLTGRGFV